MRYLGLWNLEKQMSKKTQESRIQCLDFLIRKTPNKGPHLGNKVLLIINGNLKVRLDGYVGNSVKG